ncbi:fimbrial biogenesis chaperone [Psychromonas aquimarina]|uniref:fimbrial biogenesis chaperone n=1 Tax=Psychromonas aquimarina TaxID=444919 RepID=UPI00041D5031|nr:molecular chaperone [Psychromonas aquimarina]
MRRQILLQTLFIISGLWSVISLAAVAPTSTRYFIKSSQEHINIKVKNGADETYMAQAWIEDLEGNKVVDSLSVLPSVFKIKSQGEVLLRLFNKNKPVQDDREHMFYIVVQDIPPKNTKGEINAIKIAYRSKIPLYYQPEVIGEQSRSVFAEKLIWSMKDNHLEVRNTSPFYFTIVSLDDEKLSGMNIIPPLTSFQFDAITSLPNTFRYVNDFGAFVSVNID